MAQTILPPAAVAEQTGVQPVLDEPQIIDVPEVVHVPEVPAAFHEDRWLPPALGRSLVVGVLTLMVLSLFLIAVPIWLATGSATTGFGIAALPAFWCGGGFGAVLGAAAYSLRLDD